MYIAVYGTLRHGGRLHNAIASSSCAGLFRLGGNYLMVQTPAFYPAVLEVPTSFFRYLWADDSEWWELYREANPDTPSTEDWWGVDNGFDSPLVEVYDVSSSVAQRLDIIEGVPHLYTRNGVSLSAVASDNSTRATSMKGYTTALDKFSSVRKELHIEPAEETGIYAETYIMSAASDWLQGCDIIWNGDFMNPIIHPTHKLDYVAWRATVQEHSRLRVDSAAIPRYLRSTLP